MTELMFYARLQENISQKNFIDSDGILLDVIAYLYDLSKSGPVNNDNEEVPAFKDPKFGGLQTGAV